ncbi:SusE domain-containing protein [Parapedobacter sp. ISTM3]|nr:SusE domain-containing protein [Parapedobacter sp. ISTM3]
MKHNTIRRAGWVLCYAIIAMACEKAGDTVVATGLTDPDLSATAETVILDEQERNTLALQLVWNTGEIQLTGGYDAKSMAIKTTALFALDEAFRTAARPQDVSSASLSYTHAALNELALGLGLVPGEPGTVYVRVETQLAANVPPKRSNTIRLTLTPYQPSDAADYLFMATSDFSAFPWKLCARDEDGRYDGFVRVDQWYNFYLASEESDAAPTIYGSYPEDGGQYRLHAGSDRWNLWTSNGGYLYLQADVNELTWSETVVRSLAVTGDFNGWSTDATPLTYDSERNVWTASITTTEPEQWGIKILVNGDWGFFFGEGPEEGVCALYRADAGGFAYPHVGTHTLTLDLSDPKAFRYTVD